MNTPAIRPAATLILARDGSAGLEVFMVRRSPQADFVGGNFVFPGGALDDADTEAGELCDGPDDAAASRLLGLARGGLAYFVCAIRESFEEAGLLLARETGGELLAVEPPDALRQQLNAGSIGFARLCRARGLRLAADRLAYFSHWLTPPGRTRRFDTRFFVAVAPPAQTPAHDNCETVDHAWIAPADALARHRRGEFPIVFATLKTLEALACFRDTAALMAHARSPRRIERAQPQLASGRDGRRLLAPGDYAYAEVARLDPEGTGSASYEILPGVPVRLSGRVRRITAPNPGFMTGPGTNSYLLGAGEEIAVIDPGPALAEHVQVLVEEARARIRWILVTHTHPDHSPAAALLAAKTGAQLIGMLPPAGESQDASFVPQRVPADGERLRVAGLVLKAIHTPGHASNHLCYLLEDEKLLFTGDHIMQGSTVVIAPPDGDMAVYLASLRRLLAEDIDCLAPAHGFLMDQPPRVVERLLAHRLARENKLCNALFELGEATPEALLAKVYDDVPARVHRVAARSLLAHLLKLAAEGRAVQREGKWCALPA